MMRLFAFLIAILFSFNAFSHSDGEDYIFIKVMKMEIKGEFQINSNDLENLLQKKTGDGNEARFMLFKENIDRIKHYISNNFKIAPSGGSEYSIQFLEPKMLGKEGSFLVMSATQREPEISSYECYGFRVGTKLFSLFAQCLYTIWGCLLCRLRLENTCPFILLAIESSI